MNSSVSSHILMKNKIVLQHYNSQSFCEQDCEKGAVIMTEIIKYIEYFMLLSVNERKEKELSIDSILPNIEKWETNVKSIKRVKYKAKHLNENGNLVVKKESIEENQEIDSEVSGRKICNHIIRLCSQRNTFDDEKLKILSFLELLFGSTVL